VPGPIGLDLASTPELLDFSTPRLFVFIDIPGSFVEFLHFDPRDGFGIRLARNRPPQAGCHAKPSLGRRLGESGAAVN